MIVKKKRKHAVTSKGEKKKNLGVYGSLEEAKDRLRDIGHFKYLREKKYKKYNMPESFTGVKNPVIKFNDGGSMEDMMRSMQRGKGPSQSDQPKEPEFRMTGQEASSVMMDGDREYVLYDTGVPGQDPIKVYGNWNEYAVDRDENGNDMIADEDYPITKNENGEYVLDEALYEATGPNRNADERMIAGKARKESKTSGRPGTEVLLEMLSKRKQLPK